MKDEVVELCLVTMDRYYAMERDVPKKLTL